MALSESQRSLELFAQHVMPAAALTGCALFPLPTFQWGEGDEPHRPVPRVTSQFGAGA